MSTSDEATIYDKELTPVDYPSGLFGGLIDKVLGVLLGAVGIGASAAIVVAGMNNKNKLGRISGKITSSSIKQGFAISNLIFQMSEGYIRKTWLNTITDESKKVKVEKVISTIDQILDYLGILVNSDQLGLLLKRRYE
jgi:hypothetical protein